MAANAWITVFFYILILDKAKAAICMLRGIICSFYKSMVSRNSSAVKGPKRWNVRPLPAKCNELNHASLL